MKPKHYWIEWDGKSFQAFIDTKPLQAIYSWKNIFRVVDYDKYQALEARHKKLLEALEDIKTGKGRAKILGAELSRCPQCDSAEIASDAIEADRKAGE